MGVVGLDASRSTVLTQLRDRLYAWSDPAPAIGRVEFEQVLTYENLARLRIAAWVVVLAMPLIAASEVRGLSELNSPAYWLMWRPVVFLRLCTITVAVTLILLAGRPATPERVGRSHQRWVVGTISTLLVLAALISTVGQPVRTAIIGDLGYPVASTIGAYLLGVFAAAAFVQMSLRGMLVVFLPAWLTLVAGSILAHPLWVLALPDVVDGTMMLVLAFVAARIVYAKAVSDFLNQRLLEKQQAELEEANAQLATSNDLLRRLSYLDPIMDIPNRRYLNEFLAREWRRALRDHDPVALLLIDVDHFKEYNDTYGHPAGDECLIEVATAIGSALKRSTDFLARYGGDEFAVVLPSTDLEGARHVAARILKSVSELSILHASSPNLRVSVSLGLDSWYPHMGGTVDILIAGADQALYRAKAGGRACLDGSAERYSFLDAESHAG